MAKLTCHRSSNEGWLPALPDAAALLEAAYRVDLSDEAWVRGVFAAARPSLAGARAQFVSLFYEKKGGAPQVLSTQGRARASEAALFTFHAGQIGDRAARLAVAGGPCAFLSELDEAAGSGPPPCTRHLGFADLWSLVARDEGGAGFFVGALLGARGGPLPEPLLHAWSQIAEHLASALRVRRALREGGAVPEIALAPDERRGPAESEICAPGAREALQRATRQVDRARARLRASPDEALASWLALVAGRWTLVERFDADGKRFLLARKNGPGAAGPLLSERERQTLGFAALGHSNKRIGYELGLRASTVAGHLGRAARKLGAKSRVELVQLACAEGERAGRQEQRHEGRE